MTEGNDAHVHHLLIYLCDGVNDTHVGNGGECDEGVPEAVSACRGGTLIAAWAVGGEVSSQSLLVYNYTYSPLAFLVCYRANSLVVQHSFIIMLQVFVYPDNVAYPFGGEGFTQYVLMELHYDNPSMISGAATIIHTIN